MAKQGMKIFLLFLLFVDLGYSFYQHYRMPLDGDLAEVVLPTSDKGYYQVLQDPLGISVLKEDIRYANPNRYFAHLSTSVYFKNVPLWLQNFVSPIKSIYLSCAIIKTLIQLIILLVLSFFISGEKKLFNKNFLLAGVIITPLFQTVGYNRYMGIIDQSVTYAFFYALPLALLLLFAIPFYQYLWNDKGFKPGVLLSVFLIFAMVFLSLNGPLIPGVVLIIGLLIVVNECYIRYKENREGLKVKVVLQSFFRIPRSILFFVTGFGVLSLYSLYVGRSNSLNYGDFPGLWERYSRLPKGFYGIFTSKLAFPLIISTIILNIVVIKKKFKECGRKVIKASNWICVFAFLYILLLPLGGYRIYRSNVLRYDTIIPVTTAIIFLFGVSSFFLVTNLKKKANYFYVSFIIVLIFIFTNSDILKPGGRVDCEIEALEALASTSADTVLLEQDCWVLAWDKIKKPEDSRLNADLLFYLNVTDKERIYYQK